MGSRVNACLEHLFLVFENVCKITYRETHCHSSCHVVQSGTLVSGNIQFMQVFAGVL